MSVRKQADAKSVVFGSRGSALALAQTEAMVAAFQALYPTAQCAIKTIRSKGDAVVDRPIAKIGTKGVFTKEIESALLDGSIDVAVHSLKDLPTEMPQGLELVAVPERENPYDAYLSSDGVVLDALPQGARVGSSSARRQLQLLAYRPDLTLLDIRGNVQTRIQKMRDGQYDAIILAMAGLRRLGLEAEVTHLMAPEQMLPAVGQGALGIQCRSADTALREQLSPLTDPDTWDAVHAERALLRGLGGGCQTPVGVATRVEDDRIHLRAVICAPAQQTLYRSEAHGPRDEAEALGRQVAEGLLAQMRGGQGHTAQSQDALQGRRIVVTRARAQSEALATPLEALGAEVLPFPCIATTATWDGDPLPAPSAVDWLIITSVNALRYFEQRLEAEERSLRDYFDCHVCAIGPATSQALQERGLIVSLMPREYVAEALLETLKTLEGGLSGKRFLLPRGNRARDLLPEALQEAGAIVYDRTVYQTEFCKPPAAEVAALIAACPDAITFTSASTVEAFRANFDLDQWTALRQHAVFAAIGPRTREALEAAGVHDAIQAEAYDIPGLIDALCRWVAGRG